MGNATSWSAKLHPLRDEIIIDLSAFRGDFTYKLEKANGAFDLPFNLNTKALKLEGGFLVLARREEPALARIDVHVEKMSKAVQQNAIGAQHMESVRQGIRVDLMHYSSDWRSLGVRDTDVGPVIVEVRVIADVDGMLRLEPVASGWFNSAGFLLVGSAEGSVGVYMRARFETAQDRRDALLTRVLVGVMAVVPFFFFKTLRKLAKD